MSEREPPGYDDWFDEPEPPTLESGRGRQAYDDPAGAEEDVWVLPEDAPRRRGGRGGDIVIGGRELTTTQIAILAIAALAILIAILAAAGVFSSTPAATTQSTPTHPTLPTTSTGPATTPKGVQVPTQTPIQEPNTGPQVKLLQKALISLGLLPKGKADGSVRPSTKAAVQNFQNQHQLPADGVVGKQTLAALKQALGG